MSMLRNRISQSLKKIVSETVPEAESPQLPSPSKKAGSKFKLRLQPIQYPLKKASISPKNPQKLELRRIIKKYDSDHRPRNASRCRYDFPFPNNSSFSHQGNKYQNIDPRDHLSYDELVLQREKEDDSRRLIILKQVIKENVKRKNEQMKLNSKKRLKTII